jgi:hypothetical protein
MSTDSMFTVQEAGLLSLSLRVRETIVTGLTAGGIPTDKDDRKFLTETMRDMDRTVLTIAQRRNEKEANQNLQEAAEIVGELLLNLSEKNLPTAPRVAAPALDHSVPLGEVVEGELEQKGEPLDYKKFMQQFPVED